MLENTNALISALIAVLRELRRCQILVESKLLAEDDEEEMGTFINQLHEALSDLSNVYESRRAADSILITLDELMQRMAAES